MEATASTERDDRAAARGTHRSSPSSSNWPSALLEASIGEKLNMEVRAAQTIGLALERQWLGGEQPKQPCK